MSMWKAAALSLMIPLAVAAPVMAQDQGGRDGQRMVFEEFDLNADGVVTLEELQGQGDARFAENDADGDGLLSRDELIAGAADRMAARVDRMLERADTNGDGALSQEEMADVRDGRRGPNPERIFDRLDADDDGQVTQEEFQAAAERFMERRMGHGGPRDRG